MKLSVIVTAGGSSSRYGSTNKLLEKINDKEVIRHSIDAFLEFEPCEIIVSASESLEPIVLEFYSKNNLVKVVRGGSTRQASIFNALKACSDPDIVAIHDAARPLIKYQDIEKCIQKALKHKAAIVAIFDAHKKLEGKSFSDDSGMLEFLGFDVYVVEGSYSNIKITTKKDLYIAQMLVNGDDL